MTVRRPRGNGRDRKGWTANLMISLGALLVGLTGGCDSFTPERPPDLTRPSSDSPRATSNAAPASTLLPAKRGRLVELILSQPVDQDRIFTSQIIRRETGLQKYGFRITSEINDPAKTPAQLAEAIRAASTRSTGALIVEPIDAPEVVEALHEAEAKGVAIILLDSTLPSRETGKSYPYLIYEDFDLAGTKIVEAALADAKEAKLPSDGPVLVLVNQAFSPNASQRLESLKKALDAAGRSYEVVEFTDLQKGASEKALEHIKANPSINVLLANDDYGVAGAYEAYTTLKKEDKKRTLVTGGYASCDGRLDSVIKYNINALMNRNVDGYSRQAFQVTLDLLENRAVVDRTLVPMNFIHNVPDLSYLETQEEVKKSLTEGQMPKSKSPFVPPAPKE